MAPQAPTPLPAQARTRGLALEVVAACVLLGGSIGAAAAPGAHPDPGEADVGRRLYREGIRPSGEPLAATVTGDVPVLGSQLSCETCHGRSGMGATEGRYIVPAIAGRFLFSPWPQPERPAYDRESLARALREGVSAGGRLLDPLMPRYRLSDSEVGALAAYLADLSADASPGVDDHVIRLASVVADDVSAEARDAVLAVLRVFVAEKNRQTRLDGQRRDRLRTPASKLSSTFREWVLEEWALTGPSEQWRAQLEERYRDDPVFALLGGVAGSWGPVGRFCESHQIPCLLPSSDLPDAEEGEFYTLHFSRGLALEADLVASDLAEHPAGAVLQVYCGPRPARAAAALRAQLQRRGVAVQDIEFRCGQPFPRAELSSRLSAAPGAAAVLWVGHDSLADLDQPLPEGRIYFSSTLLERKLDGPVLSAPGPAFVVHPFRLPGALDSGFVRFRVWARARGIELTHPRLQAEAFFACLAAKDAIAHLRRYFVRDFALDMLDHAQALAALVPIHPSPTFGPGQRFLTKGGYLLPVRGGRVEAESATWILP